MAILVGIDEAGYGPHLGPLVVAAAAFDFASDAPPDPDLWPSLGEHLSKQPSARDPRVIVCDSKLAYRGSRGLATLERSVLGFLAAGGHRPPDLAALLGLLAVPCAQADENAASPWEKPEAHALPAASAPVDVDLAAGLFEKGLRTLGGRPGGLWANVASAARLNRLMDGDRNKADALFALTADLMAEVLRRYPAAAIHITMDRHGGRRYYAELLSGALPMMPVETVEESPALSRYRLLRPDGPPVTVTVRDRCETWSLATALASMAAKYLRELHMIQFNAYFRARLPGLKPTAGYGLDAWRFLDDIAAATDGVAGPSLLRTR